MVEHQTQEREVGGGGGGGGGGFNPHKGRHVVSLSKDTFTSQKVLVITRKRWLRPNMTE